METTEAINWLTQKDVKPTSNRILVLKKLKAEARPVTLLDLSNKMLTMDKSSIFRVLDQDTDAVEYFNIGTGNGNSTLEIVETFERATGVKLNWKYGPRREGDIEKIWGNVDKANNVLGWKADTPLDDVLRSAWKWQLKLREDGVM